MDRFFISYIKDKAGVAAVEFALIVPILAFLFIGLVDFGMYINAEMKLENMARAASEYVRNGGDEDNLTADILAFGETADGVNDFDDITITTSTVCECDDGVEVDCAGSCNAGTGYMRQFFIVDLDMDYQPIFPYPGLPDSISLNGNARLQTQ